MEKVRPKVGVAVVVSQAGKILLGKRKGSSGQGQWAFAGGHLEFGETIEACAARELEEETGLKALSLRVGPWTNDVIEGQHYVTFFVFVDAFVGGPQVAEPEKCEKWDWFSLDSLPNPLFSPVQSFVRLPKTNEIDVLLEKMEVFYSKRDWAQFHSPKNLAMNLACEVGELLEPFRWLTEEQSYQLSEKAFEEVRDEIGDVFKVLVHLSHKLGIDPVAAASQKLDKMEQKYPAELCKGKSLKYTEYK